MINDHDLFLQLCKKHGILPPVKVVESIKSSSNTGILNLSYQSIIVPVCEVLSQVICSSTTIHAVNLADCMLLSKSLTCILDAFCEGSSVTSVNLKGNNIAGATVEHLGQVFIRNNTIKEMCLDWNSVGSEDTYFSQFCEGLMKNHSVEKMDIRYNQISPQCAVPLCKLLKSNKTLKQLDLAWNTLGLQGGKLIMESLKDNSTLTDLNLRGNCIPTEIRQIIEDKISENQRKQCFDVGDCRKKLFVQNNERDYSSSDLDSVSHGRTSERRRKKLIKKSKSLPLQQSLQKENKSNWDLDSDLELKIPKSSEEDSIQMRNLKTTEEKIEELNSMMQERAKIIEALNKELKDKVDANEAYKSKVNELQNQLDQVRIELEKSKEMKDKEILNVKKLYKEMQEKNQASKRELQESLNKLLQSKRKLENIIRKRRKDLKKSSFEVIRLKKKLVVTTQFYEDLIAKGRTEIHRMKREMKEREEKAKIEVGILKTTIRESTEALETCQTQLQKSRIQIREVSESEALLKVKLADTERVVDKCLRYKEACLKAKEDKESLEESHASALRNIASLQRQLTELKTELIEPRRKYDLLKNELEQERKKVIKLEEDVINERSRLKDKEDQITQFSKQIDNLNARILELQKTHSNELQKKDEEKWQLQSCLNKKEQELNTLKADEVKRTSSLYAAFNKFFGSINSAS